METIYKFVLDLEDTQTIYLEWNAKILSVQAQDGTICLWAQVNPENTKEEKVIRIFGTGHIFDTHGLNYLATVQLNGFVWHIYEQNY